MVQDSSRKLYLSHKCVIRRMCLGKIFPSSFFSEGWIWRPMPHCNCKEWKTENNIIFKNLSQRLSGDRGISVWRGQRSKKKGKKKKRGEKRINTLMFLMNVLWIVYWGRNIKNSLALFSGFYFCIWS